MAPEAGPDARAILRRLSAAKAELAKDRVLLQGMWKRLTRTSMVLERAIHAIVESHLLLRTGGGRQVPDVVPAEQDRLEGAVATTDARRRDRGQGGVPRL